MAIIAAVLLKWRLVSNRFLRQPKFEFYLDTLDLSKKVNLKSF